MTEKCLGCWLKGKKSLLEITRGRFCNNLMKQKVRLVCHPHSHNGAIFRSFWCNKFLQTICTGATFWYRSMAEIVWCHPTRIFCEISLQRCFMRCFISINFDDRSNWKQFLDCLPLPFNQNSISEAKYIDKVIESEWKPKRRYGITFRSERESIHWLSDIKTIWCDHINTFHLSQFTAITIRNLFAFKCFPFFSSNFWIE